jgi:hypothetical protein
VRLRYAAILFEETENLDEAEETLNKGVRLCTCPALVSAADGVDRYYWHRGYVPALLPYLQWSDPPIE